jgi:hypothetical protein
MCCRPSVRALSWGSQLRGRVWQLALGNSAMITQDYFAIKERTGRARLDEHTR